MALKPARVAGVVAMTSGATMVAAGLATWWVASRKLRDERIVVPEYARFCAGRDVAGPITALAEVDVIQANSAKAVGDLTFAELGDLAAEAKAAGDHAAEAEYLDQRNTVMTGAFLRASLLTSVISFGVAGLVVGLGMLSGIVGWGLWHAGSDNGSA